MEDPDTKILVPQLSSTFTFGGVACVIWLIVFLTTLEIWPPSVISITTALLGVGVVLIMIGRRLQGFDPRTWTFREQDRLGCAYNPIFAKLAPFGGVFGMLITSFIQYRMGSSAGLIMLPLGIVVGSFFTWLVIEHVIYASSQGSRK